jgi:hypothetical protein
VHREVIRLRDSWKGGARSAASTAVFKQAGKELS